MESGALCLIFTTLKGTYGFVIPYMENATTLLHL